MTYVLYLPIFIKVPFYATTDQQPLSSFKYSSSSLCCPLADRTRTTAELAIEFFGRDLRVPQVLLTSDIWALLLRTSLPPLPRSRSWTIPMSQGYRRRGSRCNRTALMVTPRSSISSSRFQVEALLSLLALIFAGSTFLTGTKYLRRLLKRTVMPFLTNATADYHHRFIMCTSRATKLAGSRVVPLESSRRVLSFSPISHA